MAEQSLQMSELDHRRDGVGLKYVYPVVSRRAGGISVGINLNTNNACNWACSYCQVPGLVRGAPESVDLELLAREARDFLGEVLHGSFMEQRVPPAARRLADVAFSGTGEPTASPAFPQAVGIVESALREHGVLGDVPIRLITNGSMLHRRSVRDAIAHLSLCRGEVWFKVDRATRAGMLRTNGVNLDPPRVMERLDLCIDLIPTWVQTCWFGLDGAEPSDRETAAYLDFLTVVRGGIQGVLLYGIARQPMQSGSERLTRLPAASLQRLAAEIGKRGIAVSVSP